jgi:hypothetical protein
VIGIQPANLKAKPVANHENAHPRHSLVVSSLPPALRPCHPSQNWFQTRHHQLESAANGRHRFPGELAAILSLLVSRPPPHAANLGTLDENVSNLVFACLLLRIRESEFAHGGNCA